MLGASTRRGTRGAPLLLGVGTHGSFARRPRPTLLATKSSRVVRLRALKSTEPDRARRSSGGLRRRTQRSGYRRRRAPWQGEAGSTEPTRPRNASTRKEVIRCAARHTPNGGADDVAFLGGLPERTTPQRVPDDGPARGKERKLESRFLPARLSGCSNLVRASSAARTRKQSERLAKGGQPARHRKMRTGSRSE